MKLTKAIYTTLEKNTSICKITDDGNTRIAQVAYISVQKNQITQCDDLDTIIN